MRRGPADAVPGYGVRCRTRGCGASSAASATTAAARRRAASCARRLLDVGRFLCHAPALDVWAPFIDELAAIAGPSLFATDQFFGPRRPRSARRAADVVGPISRRRPRGCRLRNWPNRRRPLYGGAALVAAELARPGTFAKLVLFEPIIFPPAAAGAGEMLASMAERRRNEWPSAADARKHLEGRGAFKAWERRSLDAYLAGGLVASPSAVTLACVPKFEGSIYRSRARGLWERLGELGCEVVIASGASSRHADGVPGLETTAALYEAMAKEARGARQRAARRRPLRADGGARRVRAARVGGVRGEESALEAIFDPAQDRSHLGAFSSQSRQTTSATRSVCGHLDGTRSHSSRDGERVVQSTDCAPLQHTQMPIESVGQASRADGHIKSGEARRHASRRHDERRGDAPAPLKAAFGGCSAMRWRCSSLPACLMRTCSRQRARRLVGRGGAFGCLRGRSDDR